MATRRARPMLIAPFIPLWAITAFFGSERLRGTPFFLPFVVLMGLLLLGLFGFVGNKALKAKRMRSRPVVEKHR